MNTYKYEGKSYEEALKKCYDELNLLESDLIINSNEVNGSLFKSKKVEIEVVKKSDLIKFIKEFLISICQKMNIEANLEIREDDDIINVQILSNNNQILIGKDGKILNSLQILLRQAVSNKIRCEEKINLDIANYKNKRLKRIEREVRNIIRDIENTKIEVSLDPMNSYERRYVHCIVSEYNNIETESFGEGTTRHVVIRYAKK